MEFSLYTSALHQNKTSKLGAWNQKLAHQTEEEEYLLANQIEISI